MKESWKWRSGRDRVRTVARRPSGGGKSEGTFAGDERVAAEHDGHVMLPAAVAATFEVIEAELSLQIFEDAFGSPALLECADEMFEWRVLRETGEIKLRWLGATVLPFDHEPNDFAVRGRHAVGSTGDDTSCSEAPGQRPLGPVAPRHRVYRIFRNLGREISERDFVATAHLELVGPPNLQVGGHADCVVQAKLTQFPPESCRVPVVTVGEDDAPRYTRVDGVTSVSRGYAEAELRTLCERAGLAMDVSVRPGWRLVAWGTAG